MSGNDQGQDEHAEKEITLIKNVKPQSFLEKIKDFINYLLNYDSLSV
jgi:hypothetical protein